MTARAGRTKEGIFAGPGPHVRSWNHGKRSCLGSGGIGQDVSHAAPSRDAAQGRKRREKYPAFSSFLSLISHNSASTART